MVEGFQLGRDVFGSFALTDFRLLRTSGRQFLRGFGAGMQDCSSG